MNKLGGTNPQDPVEPGLTRLPSEPRRTTLAEESPIDPTDALIAELREAVAARDDFIAIAAHELRNPMTPIVGQVDVLLRRAQREGASTTMIAGLERLELAVTHYVRRATALLEISRVNANQMRLEPTSFDMAALLIDTTRSYELLSAHAGSLLRCEAVGPVMGVWDRLSTEQIVDNLLSNAIRYGNGSPITVALAADEAAVTLSVADRGVGMTLEDQARIFERFEQAVGSRQKSGGFGIGLWLVHRLVRSMSGEITVASATGEGSTFTVRLPRYMTEMNGMDQAT